MNTIRNRKTGFTLIEILVAATIIAILIAISTVSYTSVNKRARDAKRKSDLEQLRSALEQYRTDNGYYPDPGSPSYVNVNTLTELTSGGYISLIPTDPASAQQYSYNPQSPAGGPAPYYGYCLSANLENAFIGTNPCTPDTSHNYGVKNP